MLTHNSGYWLGISEDLLRERRRLKARVKRIEYERIGGGDHRQEEVEWLEARAEEAHELSAKVHGAVQLAQGDHEDSGEWDPMANYPPDEAVLEWWRFQGLQWCSVHWAGTPYANRLVGVTSDDDDESESEGESEGEGEDESESEDEDEDEC